MIDDFANTMFFFESKGLVFQNIMSRSLRSWPCHVPNPKHDWLQQHHAIHWMKFSTVLNQHLYLTRIKKRTCIFSLSGFTTGTLSAFVDACGLKTISITICVVPGVPNLNAITTSCTVCECPTSTSTITQVVLHFAGCSSSTFTTWI